MVFVTDIELYPSSDGKPMAENTIHYQWIPRNGNVLISNPVNQFSLLPSQARRLL